MKNDYIRRLNLIVYGLYKFKQNVFTNTIMSQLY